MNIRVMTSTIAIVAVASTGTSWADEVSVGIKGGLNFATVSNADKAFLPAPALAAGSVESPRFIGGVFLMVPFTDVIAFQPEALYSMQGVKGIKKAPVNVPFTGVVEANAHIDVVQIPLLLRVGRKRAYVIAGPAVGFVARAILQIAGAPDFDFKDSLKSRDVSLVVGGGVTSLHVLAEARYSDGLVDINKTAGSIVNKSQVFSILAGFQF